MRIQCCDYCEKEDVGSISALEELHGIMFCESDKDRAIRDTEAFFHRRNLVRVTDVLDKFPALKDASINVPRRDGSITSGGRVLRGPFHFFEKIEGVWNLMVSWNDNQGQLWEKRVSVQSFERTDSLAPLVPMILQELDSGFYNESYQKYMEAKEQQGPLSLEEEIKRLWTGQTTKHERLSNQSAKDGIKLCRAVCPEKGLHFIALKEENS
jgi:hypothetical protein